MVGKQISGKSFGGCIRYLLNRDKAFVLDAEGIRSFSIDTIIQDLNIQRKMNPNLGKAVGHLILSWSKEDIDKLNTDLVTNLAKEYLQKMRINDTQYITVLHTDREHPHIHIVYNRVNNQGKTISDSNNYKQNVKICKELTLKYGFHFGESKREVHRDRLKGKEQIRYQLYDAIIAAAKKASNWTQMETLLAQNGIGIEFKYKSGTKEIQGVSFSQREIKTKGSAIDRSCSYKNLNDTIEQNTLANQLRAAINAAGQALKLLTNHIQANLMKVKY
ncbi:relaxase/mobilization nuclease domain-containing protein [Mucilaginibacter antarcticus]|uniref:relaxase/mobilization nuclease domain-containing protein n=1 Tax=Mucilaginibacter antarcticus TaxID=1855725 RepID=UPI00362F0211